MTNIEQIKKYLKEEIKYFNSKLNSLEYGEETEICGDCRDNTDYNDCNEFQSKIEFAEELLLYLETFNSKEENK